jgi:glycosyltransferase involved in cell wall biosynthesis
MRVLFIHPNFPGQFRHLATALARQPGNMIVGLGENDSLARQRGSTPGVQLRGYKLKPATTPGLHHYLVNPQACILRGQAALKECLEMRKLGFEPDLIVAHPGWGDALFLRQIYPRAPLIGYFEFYYHGQGKDLGFDPEFPVNLDNRCEVHMKNGTQLLALSECDAGWSPTRWQAGLFPTAYREQIDVIHDGIDTAKLAPDPTASMDLPGGGRVTAGDEVLTLINRNMEPYRGFHVFMRALPEIQRRRPNAVTLIVGTDNEYPYGNPPAPDAQGKPRTWKQLLLEEVGSRLDLNRVHFLGMLPFDQYVRVLQVSRAHVYLTYPHVLSWSMLEAMAAGCLVIASNTPPVAEVIRDRHNGLLFDFFDGGALAALAEEALAGPGAFAGIRQQARQTVVRDYDLNKVCLPRQLTLIDNTIGIRSVASRQRH